MTVGDLRRAIEPLTDECPIVVFDGEGGSYDVESAKLEISDGEGMLAIYPCYERTTP